MPTLKVNKLELQEVTNLPKAIQQGPGIESQAAGHQSTGLNSQNDPLIIIIALTIHWK